MARLAGQKLTRGGTVSASPMGNEEPIAPIQGVEIEAARDVARVEEVAGYTAAPVIEPRRKRGAGAILLAILGVAAIAALVWPHAGGGSGPAGFLVDGGGRP